MKKKIFQILKIIIGFYIIICGVLYFFQEKLIFFPQKLDKTYQFIFNQNFEEINIKTKDGVTLNGLLFKSENAKGLIFYLHGNAGALNSWGNVAKTYTDLNYDVFLLDYRGYGKSEGKITNQEQLYHDNQIFYDELIKRYNENKVVILGYSIGTGLASKLASDNNPRLLILQAPYYSMIDMMKNTYSIIPIFILKYKFETNEYLKKCEMPIIIFHGNQDNVIYYGSSIKLKEHFKSKVRLVTLKEQGHNGITDNPEYKKEIKNILNN